MRYVPAEKIEYVRNPYYWKVDARGKRLPYLDRVVVVVVKDMNLQWQKFEAGELSLKPELEDVHMFHDPEDARTVALDIRDD